MMMWQSLIKERKSQIFISVLIIFAIILGLAAALFFHSRSAREIARMQAEVWRAYSLAKSGLDIGKRLAGENSSFDDTYNIGEGTLRIQLAGGTLISTGKVGGSTRVLKKTLTPGTWAKAYGNKGADTLYFVTQAADGGYILGGNIAKSKLKGEEYGFGAGLLDLMLIKTNSSGTKEWAYAYGGTYNELSWWKAMRKADITNDGYILAAYSDSLGTDDTTLLVKVADDGTMQWARGFQNSGAGASYGPAVRQTSDSGYLLAVVTGGNILLIKTDSLGRVGTGAFGTTWARLYDDSVSSIDLWAYDVLEDVTNNRYIVVGSRQHAATHWDAIIFGVNRDNGAILFDNAFGGGGMETFNSISLAPDGKYMVGGYTTSFGPPSSQDNFLLMKTDSDGNVGAPGTWARVYDHASYNQRIMDVKPIADGYILGGYTRPSGGYEFLAAEINSTGGVMWSKVYGNGDAASGDENLSSLAQTSDSGYILGGSSNFYGNGGSANDFLVAKISATGDLSCSPNICRDAQNFINFIVSDPGIPAVTFELKPPSSPAVTSVDKSALIIRTPEPAGGVITTDVCQ